MAKDKTINITVSGERMIGKTLVIQLITEALQSKGISVDVDRFEFQPYWLASPAIEVVIQGNVVITEKGA